MRVGACDVAYDIQDTGWLAVRQVVRQTIVSFGWLVSL